MLDWVWKLEGGAISWSEGGVIIELTGLYVVYRTWAMEQQVNPYEAGQAHQQGYVDPSSSVAVTPVALRALLGTKFWVTLVGVGMLIVTVIQLVMQVFMTGMGGVPIVLTLMQLAMLAIYVVLSVRLLQYGKAIGRLSGSSDAADLERAMDVQSKFWRLLGIMCIVMFALMLISMIAGVIFASSAARF